MLKITLLADAVFEVVCAIFCFVVAISLDYLHWDDQRTLFIVLGIVFLGAAMLLAWLAYRPNRTLIRVVILLNALGAVAAFVVAMLFISTQPFSTVVYVTLAGIVFAVLAVFEFLGLRRMADTTP